MNKKVATFGEILLRLSPPDHQRIIQANSFDAVYGGSEANVAVCLSRFGIPSKIITKVPNNEIGEACVQFFRQHGIDVSQIKRDKNRLGIYFLEKGISLRPSKVIYDRTNSSISLSRRGDFDWNEIFNDVNWFHWSGITPALSQNLANISKRALEEAKRKDITISCDLNYRNLLWNYGKNPKEIMPNLVKNSDILIGNESSVKLMLGIIQKNEMKGLNEKLINKNLAISIKETYPNLKYIFLTNRKSISATHNILNAYLYNDNALYESRKFEIFPILDRIGGGDAFVAGLIYALSEGEYSLRKVLDFALASSALKLTIEGDLNLVNKKEVLNLLEVKGVDYVKR
jgi:2-dehydro-3-deoxygluconokinase